MDAFARKPPEGEQPPARHAEQQGSLRALLWGAVALMMLLMLLISSPGRGGRIRQHLSLCPGQSDQTHQLGGLIAAG